MKKVIVYLILLFVAIPLHSQYTVKSGVGEPFLAVNDTRNLIDVYLLNGLQGAEISFTSEMQATSHSWYKYKRSTNETFPVASSVLSENTSVIYDIEDGFGYYVGTEHSPGANSVVWIIDYSRYKPQFNTIKIEVEDEDKCEAAKVVVDMNAEILSYHHTSGRINNIDRVFTLEYDYLEWNDSQKQFVAEQKKVEVKGTSIEYAIEAPLVNSVYTVRGDQFARYFGEEQLISTEEYNAYAVDVRTYAYIISEEDDEELNVGQSYEAPLRVWFQAYSNELPGVMYTWKIFKIDPATNQREPSEVFRYTTALCETYFMESGIFDVVLEVKVPNSNETCTYDSNFNTDEGYEFRIKLEESYLKLPNAFSPGSSFGHNDVYKVGYKSIVSFKASIFNRWGNLLYTWNDPDKGWDGRVSGKYVPTGVYYIVVEAKGADGKIYKKSSDINILRSKNE
ncbi:gliding motility-associated-like protein [Dysgonomonadaceae bacterium PH5-43]|nr:gliding motility-associated-like protein [Dysgonomonadaceae bacterium PH5-43]